MRQTCSSPGCARDAEFTLTTDYDDRMAVIGPVATEVPHEGYDLCRHHADVFTAPQGWEIIRFDANATE